jgi:hypothetical protein
MKALLLTTIALAMATCSLYAQNPSDYKIEIGLNGGIGVNTIPTGSSALYEGSSGSSNATGSLKVDYNINENWQIGGEVGAAKWMTSGTWPITGAFGQSLQPQKVTFIIANPAISVCAQLNRVVPFYSKYTHYNKANFYYGVSAGILPTVNDGAISYSKYNKSPDPTYTYVSQYDYGFGLGYVAGVQVGFSYYIIPKLGVNVELAGRYAYVGTNETRYDHENTHYELLYFPATVGLRYRFD